MKIKNGLPARKSLGQNFLIDPNIARKIVAAIELKPEDIVVEIGPGHGVLTELILPRVQKYIGIELDNALAARLITKYNDVNHLQLIHDDFLKISFENLLHEEQVVKLVGNVPYHLTSGIIFKTIYQRQFFHSMTLMIQLEVARRIVASPGSKEYGILSVLSQTFSVPKMLFSVSRNVFFPRPKVSSAVVQWQFSSPAVPYHVENEADYIQMVKQLFQYRRKMLRTSFRQIKGKQIIEIPFDLSRRPEELTIAEFIQLFNLIKKQV